MIQALLVFNNDGKLIISEKTGRNEVSSALVGFARALVDVVGGGKTFYGETQLRDSQIQYLADDEYAMLIVSGMMDDPIITKEILTHIWAATIPSLVQNKIDYAASQAIQIILGQAIKISIFGRFRVGKTTLSKMIMQETLPLRPVSTIGAEIRLIPEGFFGNNRGVVLWDIAGQPRFQSIWPQYLGGSQLVLVTTDSSLENVLWTRRIIPKVRVWAKDAVLLGVANKQDYSHALTKDRVESILKIPTVGLVALDPSAYRENFLDTICEILCI